MGRRWDAVYGRSWEPKLRCANKTPEGTAGKGYPALGGNKLIPVNVRIITATNDDLVNSVSGGDFRQDLYHRINEFKIQLSPLRTRGSDIDIFIRHFIKLANAELDRKVGSISPEAKEILRKYDWPGNLRELKNVIKRMVLLSSGEIAGADTLPEEMLFSVSHNIHQVRESDLKAQNEVNEKQLIQKTLIQVNIINQWRPGCLILIVKRFIAKLNVTDWIVSESVSLNSFVKTIIARCNSESMQFLGNS